MKAGLAAALYAAPLGLMDVATLPPLPSPLVQDNLDLLDPNEPTPPEVPEVRAVPCHDEQE